MVEETLHLKGIADGIDLGQKGTLDSETLQPVDERNAVDWLVGKLG